jgi:hypothetical protein
VGSCRLARGAANVVGANEALLAHVGLDAVSVAEAVVEAGVEAVLCRLVACSPDQQFSTGPGSAPHTWRCRAVSRRGPAPLRAGPVLTVASRLVRRLLGAGGAADVVGADEKLSAAVGDGQGAKAHHCQGRDGQGDKAPGHHVDVMRSGKSLTNQLMGRCFLGSWGSTISFFFL